MFRPVSCLSLRRLKPGTQAAVNREHNLSKEPKQFDVNQVYD